MANPDDKIEFSKKGKREISPFIGHELLYDYLSGNLDKDRKAAVEDHVKFSRDAQSDLTKIQNGQAYAEKLSSTVVSQPIIEMISSPTNYINTLAQKSNFEKWPQGLKWGLEALVVVFAIVVLLTLTPWQKVIQFGESLGSKEVILAEATKSETTTTQIQETPQFADEGVKASESQVAELTAPTVAPTQTAATKPTPSPSATVVATSPAKTTTKLEGQNSQANVADVPAASSGGFLYRGDIAITNINSNGPKISEKMAELGARKAGAVELGWKKTPTSMYYHFTIPEAKYQELVNFLGAYGKVRLVKEKHPRVMPDGIVRMIITLDEKSP